MQPLIDANELAEFLRVTPEHVRAQAKLGKLPGVQIGKAWRFSKEIIERMIEDRLKCVSEG